MIRLLSDFLNIQLPDFMYTELFAFIVIPLFFLLGLYVYCFVFFSIKDLYIAHRKYIEKRLNETD